MVKICDDAVKKPLSIICKNWIKTGIYLNPWKKSNIVLVHEKGDEQIVDNYRPVSLLPNFGKVFEKILFDSVFGFLPENCPFWDNQSGFRPSGSCEYQLLSISHDIYACFDCNHLQKCEGDISWYIWSLWYSMAWRALLKNEMYWYNRYASKIVAKLSLKETPTNSGKWSLLIMSIRFWKCITRFCIGPFVLFYLHKLINKGHFIN